MSNYSLPCSIRGAASGGEVSGEWKMTVGEVAWQAERKGLWL